MRSWNIDSRLDRCLIAVMAVEKPPFAIDFPDLHEAVFRLRFLPELRGVYFQFTNDCIHGSLKDLRLSASFQVQ